MIHAVLPSLLALLLAALASPAAAERASVVLVRSGAWPEGEARVAAELEAVGLDLRRVDGAGPMDPEEVGAFDREALRAAAGDDALCAMWLMRREGWVSVLLWCRGLDGSPGSYEEIGLDTASGEDDAGALATRVAEVVLARQLAAQAQARAAPSRAARAPPAKPPEPAFARAGVGLGLGTIGLPVPAGVNLGVLVSGFWGPHRNVLVEADVYSSARLGRLSADPVDIRLGYSLFRARVLFRALADRRASPSVGVGGGALLAWAFAGDESPRHAETSTHAVIEGAAGLSIRLVSSLVLKLAVRSGVFLPTLGVVTSTEDTVSIGRPFVEGALGLAWTWPPSVGRRRRGSK